MGEVLNESELEYMLQLAEDPSSENPELIKIERIVQILIPSDNIMDEIKQKIQAEIDQKQKEEEALYASQETEATKAADSKLTDDSNQINNNYSNF